MLLHDACPSVMVMVVLQHDDDYVMLHAAKTHLSVYSSSLFVLFAQVAQSARVVDDGRARMPADRTQADGRQNG